MAETPPHIELNENTPQKNLQGKELAQFASVPFHATQAARRPIWHQFCHLKQATNSLIKSESPHKSWMHLYIGSDGSNLNFDPSFSVIFHLLKLDNIVPIIVFFFAVIPLQPMLIGTFHNLRKDKTKAICQPSKRRQSQEEVQLLKFLLPLLAPVLQITEETKSSNIVRCMGFVSEWNVSSLFSSSIYVDNTQE